MYPGYHSRASAQISVSGNAAWSISIESGILQHIYGTPLPQFLTVDDEFSRVLDEGKMQNKPKITEGHPVKYLVKMLH